MPASSRTVRTARFGRDKFQSTCSRAQTFNPAIIGNSA
jgi:hypothetical protein